MRRLIAGGYAAKGAEGLYLLEQAPGSLHVAGLAAPVCNVSAGLPAPGGTRWFVVDEVAGTLLLLDPADGWRTVASRPAGGAGPCHLALDAVRGRLAVAHYGSGTTAVFRLTADGMPDGPPVVHWHQGHGPDADRQARPHAHWVGFDADGRLYVTDLGADRIWLFDADAACGLGAPRVAWHAPAGSGPRRIAFHPAAPIAALVSELASTVTIFAIAADGGLRPFRTVSTLPPGVVDPANLGGAIVIHGDRLHVTNRGQDSVATFAVASDGDVRLLAHRATGGRSPRFLLVVGDRLLVAHEEGGGVTALPLDTDGRPGAVEAQADLPGAAFLGDLG